jgi:hypothetical protein
MHQSDKPARITASQKILLIIGLLISLSLACNKPAQRSSVQEPDKTALIEISVRETLAALDEDLVIDADDQSPDELTPSETPEPVISDTPTLTPTATDTPTPEVARIYVSANTNCRTGQGTFFSWLVTLQEGEESEAVGIDTSGDYWYIRRPDIPSQFCWLWGKYATPSGPYESLPVYTQIPTPTPGFDFKLTYLETFQCGPWWGLQFQLDNTGSFTLESWRSTGTDNSGGLVNSPNEQDQFFSSFGCVMGNAQSDLTPGEGSYVNVVFNGDPSGHNITAIIKACTKDGMAGDCLKKSVTLKP